ACGLDRRLLVGADAGARRAGRGRRDAGQAAALVLARLGLRASLGLLDADAARLVVGPAQGARARCGADRRRDRPADWFGAGVAGLVAGGCRAGRGGVRARAEPACTAALRAA